jgi:ribulose kinase
MTSGNHYLGVDVGTGGARVCLIDSDGNVKGIAAEDIRLWTDRGESSVCLNSPLSINPKLKVSTDEI